MGLGVLGGGGWYWYKRAQGHVAPPVAPAKPPSPANNPTVLQPANASGPSAALAAITGGDTSTMSPNQAQTAIDAANAAGAYASSDLGNAAGGPDYNSDPASSAPPDDMTVAPDDSDDSDMSS
jgi:hypothetical protein